MAGGAHAPRQQLVARIVRDALDGQLPALTVGSMPTATSRAPSPSIAALLRSNTSARSVSHSRSTWPRNRRGGQVQLDVELAQLVLHVRPAQARQDRVVDQPRPAQWVHEIELHLHPDGVLMGDEPAAVDHAPQRDDAPP